MANANRPSSTRWGEAILRVLSERHWTRRHLARRAKLQPNTITNIVKHGRPADTRTLLRIADACEVDIGELLVTAEQAALLRTHREHEMPVSAYQFLWELDAWVRAVISGEFERFAEQTRGDRKPAPEQH